MEEPTKNPDVDAEDELLITGILEKIAAEPFNYEYEYNIGGEGSGYVTGAHYVRYRETGLHLDFCGVTLSTGDIQCIEQLMGHLLSLRIRIANEDDDAVIAAKKRLNRT